MYIPIHAHSYSSLLDGAQSPQDMVNFCLKHNIPAVGLTDHGVLFGAVELNEAASKAGIKSIQGCELYLCGDSAKEKTPSNRKLAHLCVLSRNYKGWQKLVKIVSAANHPDNFYYKPRLSLDELADFVTDDLIAFSGHAGSELGNACITSLDGYRAETLSEARNFMRSVNEVIPLALKYKEIFKNFFIEIQLIDEENIPITRLIGELLREVSQKTGIPCVGTADSHYTNREDAHIQRILLCSSLRTTLKTVYNKLDSNEEFGLAGFFKSNNYHIPTLVEMQNLHTKHELKNTLLIGEMCEQYSLQQKPKIPSLYSDDNLVITQKCYSSSRLNKDRVYEERLKHELEVITRNGLSGYFLIMEDIVKYAESNGILCGLARGSAGGCLTSYLLGITQIDPIPYGLIFERFYNDGRNTKDKVSLPDIDVDFEKSRRNEVIDYIKDKYGHDKVGHIMTVSTLQGRGAIKEVLRVYNACGQMEMNEITSRIPQEAEISDHLEVMRQEKGYISILEWTLENDPESIEAWAKLENGEITGEYSKYFKLAIELEGAKKNISKHASGIIISNEPLTESTPLINQGGELVCGLEMGDLEKMGMVKVDILGINTLSKIQSTLQEIACIS